MELELNWNDFKSLINQGHNFKYISISEYYILYILDRYKNIFTKIPKISPLEIGGEQEDFENNYLSLANNNSTEIDITGREIIRTAATIRGWHYQAHSVQFEVNKLNSIYNKDCDGVDLGFCSIKIYDENGIECTTQSSADLNGVKTIVTWSPDFDFEIISGNIRQDVKETIDSYVYVNLKAHTGLPSPYDVIKVPFVQGGINLKYIGADEPLRTDGRASKLVKAATNNDFFEIIVNYDKNILTTENRHKMSLIFEIYKDPTS